MILCLHSDNLISLFEYAHVQFFVHGFFSHFIMAHFFSKNANTAKINWGFILLPCTTMLESEFTLEPIDESDNPKLYSGDQLHNCCGHLPGIGNVTPTAAF